LSAAASDLLASDESAEGWDGARLHGDGAGAGPDQGRSVAGEDDLTEPRNMLDPGA
jgi:hypothetical protein